MRNVNSNKNKSRNEIKLEINSLIKLILITVKISFEN